MERLKDNYMSKDRYQEDDDLEKRRITFLRTKLDIPDSISDAEIIQALAMYEDKKSSRSR